MARGIRILDVVALTEAVSEKGLALGQVGTVVEEIGDDTFEVEFSDTQGKIYAMAAIPASKLMLLRYEPVKA